MLVHKAVEQPCRGRLRLNEAMMLRDIKPSELAKLSGVNEGAISQYRKGSYKAGQRSLEKIAAVLRVSMPWLMGADVPMEEDVPEAQTNIRRTQHIQFPGFYTKSDCIPSI